MQTYKPIIQKYGCGKPIVVIIGSAHGNELLGKKVIFALSKAKIIKGTLITIIANPLAVKNKKRFIDVDLNRCFPGKKNGKIEEKIAYYLVNKIKQADYLIDIHSTTADTEDMAIIKNRNNGVKVIIKNIGIKNIILISKEHGNHSLIKHCSSGVGLEYGGRDSKQTYNRALGDIKRFLIKIEMIKSEVQRKKTERFKHYILYGEEKKPKNFVVNEKIQNFQLIKKGGLLGRVKDKEMFAQESF